MDLTPSRPRDLPPHLSNQPHFELEVTFEPPSRPLRKGRVAKSGLMFHPLPTEDGSNTSAASVPIGEASGRHGAVLLFDWLEQRLDVVFSDGSTSLQQLAVLPYHRYRQLNSQSVVAVEHGTVDSLNSLDNEDGSSDEEAEVERRAVNISGCHAVGGALHFSPPTQVPDSGEPAWQPITLRVFMDHSLLEVFTSTGEVLTTRVYRGLREVCGVEPASSGAQSAVQLISVGVPCTARQVAMHQMSSIWHEPAALAALEQEAAEKAAAAKKAAGSPVSTKVHKPELQEQEGAALGSPLPSPCQLVVLSDRATSPPRFIQSVA